MQDAPLLACLRHTKNACSVTVVHADGHANAAQYTSTHLDLLPGQVLMQHAALRLGQRHLPHNTGQFWLCAQRQHGAPSATCLRDPDQANWAPACPAHVRAELTSPRLTSARPTPSLAISAAGSGRVQREKR